MNTHQALLVCQLLLKRAGSRVRLRQPSHCGTDFWSFTVVGRGRLGNRIVVPFVHSYQGYRILGILDQTGRNARWSGLGQALTGCRQLAHYGDIGQVVVRFGQPTLLKEYHLGSPEVIPRLSPTLRKLLTTAPAADQLTVRDRNTGDDVVTSTLPGEDVAQLLSSCLAGAAVAAPGNASQLIAEFGLDLCLGTGTDRGMLLSRETLRRTRSALLTVA
ncbi:hypothetical protein [Pseudomonas oryzihabitans]|uniref:hypothetical protein n=1 Tax=Pseudomonas oryzihabitans TaxID=47885 RepID=UPI00214EB1F5|nr:hypothetical protein [Pseudomonas psychrotolerans]UUW74304.1 hypothetical protein NRG74_23435 [Pseudomonas psychrotolerans]